MASVVSTVASSTQQKKSTFIQGSIIKISLHNFLTFDDFSFRANPNLNVIVGPNGTGKSSIVCAICLGLAGKPNALGRAKQLGDYVKHGKDKAVIEIELCDVNENPKIRREINLINSEEMKTTSNWSINGETKTVKQVKELVAKFNIQISNLCQFLPQERVADFAKMNKIELLENTELAICSQQMIDDHTWLKDHQNIVKDLELRKNEDSLHLDKLIQKNQRVEKEVIRYKERVKLTEKLEIIQQKIACTVYEEARRSYVEHKKALKVLNEKKVEAEKETLPLFKKKEKISKEISLISSNQAKKAERVKSIASKTKTIHTNIQDMETEITQLIDDYNEKKKDEQNKEKKLEQYKLQISIWQNELDSLEDCDVQSQVDEINHKMRQTLNQITKADQDISNLNNEKENIKHQLKAIDKKVAELQNLKNRRLDILQQKDRDCYKAIMWLRENKNMFEMTIYEPIMLVLNMNEVRFAELVENHVAMRDMFSFVCEDYNDNAKFIQEVREKKGLKINVVLAPRSNGQLMEPEQYKPRRSLQELKQWGFCSFLRELVDAPSVVMAYLCKQYRIHDVPIGTPDTKAKVDEVVSTSNLDLFYIPTHQSNNRTTPGSRYSVRKSKYSNDRTTANRALHKANYLNIKVDPVEIQQLGEQKEDLLQTLSKIDENLKEVNVLYKKLEKQNNDLCTEKKELQQKKNHKRTLENKIKFKQKNYEDVEKSCFNLDELKLKVDEDCRQIYLKKRDLVKVFVESITSCVNSTIDEGMLIIKYTQYIRSKLKIEQTIRDMKLKNVDILKAIESAEIAKSEAQARAKELLKQAQDKTGTDFSHLNPVFSNFPNELSELESLKHEYQAKLDCCGNTDPNAFHEFNERKKEVEELEKKIEEAEQQLSNRKETMTATKDRWLKPLTKLVSKINDRFSKYFAFMKCAGEVDIHTDNPDEFDKYGIRIRVKFRSNTSLQELNPYRQSGGERSVSTMLYLVAMQSMYSCPFRVVDEINQGMDPNNERRVFEIIVNSCALEKSSQYFLFTPKLLPNLTYNEYMTVHVIHNGPSLLSHRDWKISRFIRKRGMLKYEDDDEAIE